MAKALAEAKSDAALIVIYVAFTSKSYVSLLFGWSPISNFTFYITLLIFLLLYS